MQRFRDSIASLIGVVGLVAVAAAGLRAATPEWDSGLFGVTLVVLLVGILLAIHRQGRKRAFRLGFAIFGWVTLGASLVPSIAERLPTTKGLTRLTALHRVLRPANMNFFDYDLDGSLDLSVTTRPPNGPAPPNKGYASGVSFEKWMMWKKSGATVERFIAIGQAWRLRRYLLLSRSNCDRDQWAVVAMVDLPRVISFYGTPHQITLTRPNP